MRKIIAMALAASVSCAALLSSPATAAYPEKPVSFVVPNPFEPLGNFLTYPYV